MTREELFADFKAAFVRRRFSAGLLIAMVDFLGALRIGDFGISSYAALLRSYPKRTTTASGGRAVTLIVDTGDGNTLSLRPFYNAAETFFRSVSNRYDYPSCAPHATQAWTEYEAWLESLCAMTDENREQLRTEVVEYVLELLPDQQFDPATLIIQPALFKLLLEEFDFASPRGEPSGAALQGAVFGFIRADNPHLQVEIDKVRTGSRRRSRVGDIDAWEGKRLAVSAESKQLQLTEGSFEHLSGFVHEVTRRGAIGLVVAAEMDEGLRTQLAEHGVRGRSVEDLVSIVELWDPAKQRIAVESMRYYAAHIERNSVLIGRLDDFVNALMAGS